MQKHDPLSLGPDARLVIDEPYARGPAPLDHRVEVVDSKADVMYPWPAFGDEASYWRFGIVGLQQLHQRLSSAEARDVRAVGIIERNFGQSQHIPKKRQGLGEGLDRDSNVGYARATRG